MEWCSVCNCVVISAIEGFVDYGDVHVFHVCFDLFVWVCVRKCSFLESVVLLVVVEL